MYNQTQCTTENNINNQTILSLVVAGCSFLTAVGTFAYFKISSKFKDLQHSEVEIKTLQEGEKKETSIKVKFINDENFEMTAKSKKNGNSHDESLDYDKITNHLLSPLTFETKSSQALEKEQVDLLISNFNTAINNNNLGDQIIANTRKGLILHTLNTFLKTIKIYNVNKEEVMVISNNNSKAPSLANNLLYHGDDEYANEEEITNISTKESIISSYPGTKITDHGIESNKSKNVSIDIKTDQSTQHLMPILKSSIEIVSDNKSTQISFFKTKSSTSKSDTSLKYNSSNSKKNNLDDTMPIANAPKSKSYGVLELPDLLNINSNIVQKNLFLEDNNNFNSHLLPNDEVSLNVIGETDTFFPL